MASPLFRPYGSRGHLIQDASLAAKGVEHNRVLVTTDADYARFPGLRWRHPLTALHKIQPSRLRKAAVNSVDV
jgi:predicted nucleic acid-binding protein